MVAVGCRPQEPQRERGDGGKAVASNPFPSRIPTHDYRFRAALAHETRGRGGDCPQVLEVALTYRIGDKTHLLLDEHVQSNLFCNIGGTWVRDIRSFIFLIVDIWAFYTRI